MSKVFRLLIYKAQGAKVPLVIWDSSRESLNTGYRRVFRIGLVSAVSCMVSYKYMENLHCSYLLISSFFSPIIYPRSKMALILGSGYRHLDHVTVFLKMWLINYLHFLIALHFIVKCIVFCTYSVSIKWGEAFCLWQLSIYEFSELKILKEVGFF